MTAVSDTVVDASGNKDLGVAADAAALAGDAPNQQAVSALRAPVANADFDPLLRVEAAIASMGSRIEARRKIMGLTLEQVADRAGMSKSYIWEIENGKNKNPTIRTAFLLGRALGWSLSEVVGVWEHASLLHPEAMKIAMQVDYLLRPTSAAPVQS